MTNRRLLTRILKPLALLALIFILLAQPIKALAHPIDQYLQITYVTVGTTQVEIEMDLTSGVLVAPTFLPTIDSNNDNVVSQAEGEAYAAKALSDTTLKVDGITQTLTLDLTRLEIPAYNVIQAGYGTFRIFATTQLAANLTGTHHISFTNAHHPASAAYQVNAFIQKGASITLGTQNRSDNQQSLEMDYTLTSDATPSPTSTTTITTTTTTTDTTSSNTTAAQSNQMLGFLTDPNQSIWLLLGALGLATILGGLHALTPGHGKTLVAAYLVGSRGTIKHAIALGGIVTVTHTSSVIIIGVLALVASQFVLPGVLVPTLEIASGLLVLYIGARLAYFRFRAFRNNTPLDHGHSHDPNDPNSHTHDFTQPHSHDTQHSALSTQHSDVPTRRDLLTMGISGGIIPCPEALGVMLIAVSLNRIALGLGMIVAFSLGLALVLIAIGILLVKARSVMSRLSNAGTPLQRYLPLASAIIVTLLGLGIVLKGLTTYLG